MAFTGVKSGVKGRAQGLVGLLFIGEFKMQEQGFKALEENKTSS